MKKKIPAVVLVLILCVGTASAQFGSGIVYDPTNYQNALLRYYQLQQHLIQLQQNVAKVTAHGHEDFIQPGLLGYIAERAVPQVLI